MTPAKEHRAIPLILHEEHHEAYAIWHAAVLTKLISPDGNTLLHVDAHSDLDPPIVQADWPSIECTVREVYEFALSELDVGNFICPAIFDNTFRAVHWIYPDRDEDLDLKRQTMGVLTVRGSDPLARQLVSSWVSDAASSFDNGDDVGLKRLATGQAFVTQSPVTSPVPISQVPNLVVGIDLDYFSCNSVPRPFPFRIEISREEFCNLSAHLYHPLRLIYGRRIRLEQEGGRYLLHFLSPPTPPSPLKVDTSRVKERIEAVLVFLQRLLREPSLITVARSRISGFTPIDQCMFIEEHLLGGLARVFSTEINHISDLLSPQGLTRLRQ